ncbi:MAG: type II toxin-antitoxin system HicA family toxin [Ahrensia sp.]|nr:type II toxin-antitoxin system HicA family toxin [Ahrensia sp.]
MEQKTRKIRAKLIREGWVLKRHGSSHDLYEHPAIRGTITLPRHPTVSPLVYRSIAKRAGWRLD